MTKKEAPFFFDVSLCKANHWRGKGVLLAHLKIFLLFYLFTLFFEGDVKDMPARRSSYNTFFLKKGWSERDVPEQPGHERRDGSPLQRGLLHAHPRAEEGAGAQSGRWMEELGKLIDTLNIFFVDRHVQEVRV